MHVRMVGNEYTDPLLLQTSPKVNVLCSNLLLSSVFQFLPFFPIRGDKSAITSCSHADLRGERDTGEILDPLLLFYVLCGQLLWKGIN